MTEPTITARVYAEPVTGCVAILVTRQVRAAGKLEDVHAEASHNAGMAWRWTTTDTPIEPLLRCPLEVLDAIVDARLAQRQEHDHHTPAAPSGAVRIGMSVQDGEALAALLPTCPADVRRAVSDQLWLRVVLTEQRRRVNRDERAAFDQRADRLLAQLDPAPIASPAEEDEHWQDPLDLYPSEERAA